MDLHAARPLGARHDSGEDGIDLVAGDDEGTDHDAGGVACLVAEGSGEPGAVDLLQVARDVDLDVVDHRRRLPRCSDGRHEDCHQRGRTTRRWRRFLDGVQVVPARLTVMPRSAAMSRRRLPMLRSVPNHSW